MLCAKKNCSGIVNNFCDNMLYSGLDNSLQPIEDSPMLDCYRLARLKGDWSYPCCFVPEIVT